MPTDPAPPRCQEKGGRAVCALPAGHEGQHVADGPDNTMITWYSDPTPPRDAPLTAEEARRTMLDLDEIERRADAASPGPWGVWTSMDNTYDILSEAVHPHEALAGLYGRAQTDHPTPQEDADAAFIAASRTDVPALIAELRRLRAVEQERDALRKALASIDLKLEVARLGLDRNGPQHARITEAREIARAALEAAGDPARRTGEAG